MEPSCASRTLDPCLHEEPVNGRCVEFMGASCDSCLIFYEESGHFENLFWGYFS